MTLAHELGHWICGDAYDGSTGDDHEKMINAFAIHFLAPRAGVQKYGTSTTSGVFAIVPWRWDQYSG